MLILNCFQKQIDYVSALSKPNKKHKHIFYIQILADTFTSVNEIQQNIIDLTLYEFV